MRWFLTVFLLFVPGLVFGDVFEGEFSDKLGNIVEVKAISSRVYVLKKRVFENGRERIIRGRGVLVNGTLYGQFNKKKSKSFKNRLKVLGGEDEDDDITLGEFVLTRREAERVKGELALKQEAAKRIAVARTLAAGPPKRSPKSKNEKSAQKSTGQSSNVGVIRPQPNSKGSSGGGGSIPPTVPSALTLLALAALRRRQKSRFIAKGKRVGGVAYKKVLPGIRASLSFSARDKLLRAKLAKGEAGIARRLTERLKELPQSVELLFFADGLRDLGARSNINRLGTHAKRMAAQLEKLAEVIDKIVGIASQEGNRSFELLAQEKRLNRVIDKLEHHRSANVFLSDEILKVGGDDPRNKIVDLADPTKNFERGGILQYTIGYGKLAAYAVADYTLGNLSRTDANIDDYNAGRIDDEEYRSRELNGVVNDVGKLAITVAVNSLPPVTKMSKVGEIGFSTTMNALGGTGNFVVDALTGKGRGEKVESKDLLKELAGAVIAGALAPAGGVKLTKAVPQTAKRAFLRKVANARVLDAAISKGLEAGFSTPSPKEPKEKKLRTKR